MTELKPEEVRSVDQLDQLLQQQQVKPALSTYIIGSVLFPPLGLYKAWKKNLLDGVLPWFTFWETILFVGSAVVTMYIFFTLADGKLADAALFLVLTVIFTIAGIGAAWSAHNEYRDYGDLSISIKIILISIVLLQYLIGFYGSAVGQGITPSNIDSVYQLTQ